MAGTDDIGEEDETGESSFSETADLKDSLAALSRLGMGRGEGALSDMLTHVAQFAVRAIPGATVPV